VKDAKTPPEIIQQIALNTESYQAKIVAISRIVNSTEPVYPKEVFYKLLKNINIKDSTLWENIPQICMIILQ
jgi:N-acyl-L-homoserine lactone synthetase